MPYSTPPDVRLIIDTTLTDTQISDIIQMSDTQIDKRIGSQASPGELVKKLSALLTAHTIRTRQPTTLAIGEYREESGNVLETWERETEMIYRLLSKVTVKASGYSHIDDDERHPQGGLTCH